MKEIFVDQFIEDNGMINGVVGYTPTVLENISIVYPANVAKYIQKLALKKEDFYLFDRFCQFIVYIQFQASYGFSMKVYDFGNDLDLALDEYQILKDKQWNKEDLDKIMKLFIEIKNSDVEKAKMTIRDPLF